MQDRRSSTTAVPNASTDRWKLQASDLELPLDPAALGFRTTDELEPLDRVHGQERALRALELGLAVRHRGYNIYVSGMTGTGKKQLIQELLEARAGREATPDDWVYVHNFEEPDRPRALRLPSGHGVRLRTALEEVIDRLRHDLPAALKAKDFDAERERLAAKFGQQSEALFNQLVERGRQLDMVIRRLPNGAILFVPLKDGRPMERQDVERLSDEERADIERRQMELGELASALLAKQQEMSHQLRQEIQDIVRGFARRIIESLIARVKSDHPGDALVAWLDRVQGHMLDHLVGRQSSIDGLGGLPFLED
jgi:hypothetical protein